MGVKRDMTVYVVLYEPRESYGYGDISEILGVFDTRNKAVDCILDVIKEDVIKGDYVAKMEDLKGIVSGKYGTIDVWQGREDNSSEWYQLTIFVKEIK